MVFVVPNGGPTTRLGVSATRKIGGAVQRNLAKRRLRELFRRADLPSGVDIVVVPKREFFDAEWDVLRNDFLSAFRRGYPPPSPGVRRDRGL
jgi:ribonuclease P protein component